MSEPVKIAADTLPEVEEQGRTLPCPCCGEPDATINLTLSDCSFTCCECDTEFTTADVQNFIRQWTPILAWIRQMPMASE